MTFYDDNEYGLNKKNLFNIFLKQKELTEALKAIQTLKVVTKYRSIC